LPRARELPGSRRPAPVGAAAVGEIDPDEPVVITIHVKRRGRRRPAPGSRADLARLLAPTTREALAAERARTHGPIIDRFVAFAHGNGLEVLETDPAGRTVTLRGSAGRLRALFGAALHQYDDGRRQFRARSGALTIPAEIAPWTRAILGFDLRPQVQRLKAQAGSGLGQGLWPTEIASLYGIPLDRDVSAASIGIIALGGGYQQSDLAGALQQMGRSVPNVVQHPVGNARNNFGNGSEADQEIALDLQIVAALLPTARITVYFAENTTVSLAQALKQAVHDDVNRPSVVSISWGSMETEAWTLPARNALQAILADAVRLHVTVVAASGDELATCGALDGEANVNFPASSPYVLACGGTAPVVRNGAIAGESVWNDGFTGTGGGISAVFPVPAYQANAGLPSSLATSQPGRGVPDVAAAAAKIPGYSIVLNGVRMAKDGTSAATPLWASLIAMANAARGSPVGLVNPSLYAEPALCRAITQGNNRVNGIGYDAGPGWSACTGLGVPKGAEVIAALAAPKVA